MKILIADDEKLICEWLQFSIKENPEYEIVGIAGNGEQALALYKEWKPDLVLTDIKMPVMNGLELLKEIKKTDPSALIVLLTAFSEFEYAREAIKENVNDYILKTEINNECFHEMLKRMAEIVADRKGEDEKDIQYNGQKHTFIRNLLRQRKAISDSDRKKLERYQIRWRNQGLFVAAVLKNQLKTEFVLSKHRHIKHVVGIEYDEYSYIMAGNLSRDLSEAEKVCALHEYANLISDENQCMVGLSNISDNLSMISLVVEEAVAALAIGFYREKQKVYCCMVSLEGEECRNRQELQIKKKYQEFCAKNGKDQYAQLKDMLAFMEEEQVENIGMVKHFCKDCLEVIYLRYAIDNMEVTKKLYEDEKRKIDEICFFSEIKKLLLSYAWENIWDPEIEERTLSHNIFKAVEFIRQNYNQPLSLEQIAGKVNLNPEYLSRVFKEETGQTYSSYLANLRMTKAENLLKNTTGKVQDIAETVGYSNVSYFSTIFKKRYGLNPYEFRRKRE